MACVLLLLVLCAVHDPGIRFQRVSSYRDVRKVFRIPTPKVSLCATLSQMCYIDRSASITHMLQPLPGNGTT
jgi:hypothetical protein